MLDQSVSQAERDEEFDLAVIAREFRTGEEYSILPGRTKAGALLMSPNTLRGAWKMTERTINFILAHRGQELWSESEVTGEAMEAYMKIPTQNACSTG